MKEIMVAQSRTLFVQCCSRNIPTFIRNIVSLIFDYMNILINFSLTHIRFNYLLLCISLLLN